jgi:WD40 repeat protein/tRNA A-37 threonylcarbamoyl transferase component Bud32
MAERPTAANEHPEGLLPSAETGASATSFVAAGAQPANVPPPPVNPPPELHLPTQTAAEQTLPAAAPRLTLPGYEILGELGRGGMGVVYKARQLKLGRLVALKVVLTGAHAAVEELERFRREAEAVARLQHPNIVQIYEVGEHDGQPYLALELAEGGGLDRQLRRGPLASSSAATLVKTLAGAVAHAHEHRIIHRDLKPANVLLAADGNPKVTDFGLAKQLDSPAGQTQSGAILGTPSYMAPEQAAGKTRLVGPATDIYALGAILYETLTGRPPFLAETALDTLQQVLVQEALPPRRLQPKVPRDLETVCLKCLEKSPARRYGSARDLADDLGRFLAGEPVRARPIGPWERARKWVRRRPALAALLAVSAVAALALAGGGVGLIYSQRLQEVNRDLEEAAGFARAQKVEADTQRGEADRQRGEAERQRSRAETREAEARRYLYATRMSLAHRAWEEAHIPRLRELLEEYLPGRAGPEELRGFEWYYLWRRAHAGARTLATHAGRVNSVAFSPDGRRLASASSDGTVKVWHVPGGKLGVTFARHGDSVHGVAFSPDGKRLASAGHDRTVRLWDSDTGGELHVLRGHSNVVEAVAFNRAGDRLASAGFDKTVKIWDAVTGREIATLRGHILFIQGIAFNSAGDRLASASADGTVRIWDLGTEKPVFTLAGGGGPVASVAFSPDGTRLASAAGYFTRPGEVRIWDATTGKLVQVLRGHASMALALAYSPDGTRLATAGSDRTVRLWDPRKGQLLVTHKGHASMARAVAFSPDGRRLASGDGELRDNRGDLILWDAAASGDSRSLPGHSGIVHRVAFRPDGRRLASASADRTVRVWDPDTCREVLVYRSHTASVWAVAYSPDGSHLASAGDDRVVRLWEAETGREKRTLSGHGAAVRALAFSPDGRHLASAGHDRTVRVWEVASGTEALALPVATKVLAVAFSPNGRLLAAGGQGRAAARGKDELPQVVTIWDAATGALVRTLRGPRGSVYRLAFCPDGRRLAVAGGELAAAGRVTVWDLDAGRPALTLKGHVGMVWGVAVSRDGRRLATAGLDKTIKVWEAVTGQETLTLRAPGAAWDVAFGPDSQRLASACTAVNSGENLLLWDGEPQRAAQEAGP